MRSLVDGNIQDASVMSLRYRYPLLEKVADGQNMSVPVEDLSFELSSVPRTCGILTEKLAWERS